VTIQASGGPFAESLFSLRLLRRRSPSALVAEWARVVRTRLGSNANPLTMLDLLEQVVDPHETVWLAPSIEEALRWLDKARPDIAPELSRWFVHYYRQAVEPYWRRIRSHLEAEQARRGRVMADGGIESLLAGLHPRIQWRAPLLEVRGERLRDAGQAHPLQLRGRPLVCVPSVFSTDGPRILIGRRDATVPAVLVYPALRSMVDASSLWTEPAMPSSSALARLLGRTQASALATIADTCTTTELALRLGIALATASHHASVLRGAGLVFSRRAGNTVVHRLTVLGADLLGQPGSDQ
jgi:DNA-binding transcriptional ArsR family regulator